MPALTILSSGKEIYLERHEPSIGTDDETTPIILVHGLLASSETYRSLLDLIPNRTRIVYDSQGHGRTPIHRPTSSPLTMDSLAADITDILAHYSYHRADVVAWSGGSYIAMHFAATFPDKIRKLVLLGPPAVPAPRELILGNAARVRGGLESFVAVLASGLGAKAQSNEHIVAALQEETLKQDKESVAEVIECLAGFQIGEIKAETLVIMGTEDRMSDRMACQSVQEVTKGRLVELPTGHYFTLEDPQATAAAIAAFL